LALKRSPRTVGVAGNRDDTGAGVALVYADAAARRNFRIGPAPSAGAPAGRRALATNDSWIAIERC
jgi:hypothetical protein